MEDLRDWLRLFIVTGPFLYLFLWGSKWNLRISYVLFAGFTLMLARGILDVTDNYAFLNSVPVLGANDPGHVYYKDFIGGLLGLGLVTWGFSVEVLKRWRTERALLIDREFRDAVLSSLDAGVLVLDQNNHVVYLNPKAANVVATATYRDMAGPESDIHPRNPFQRSPNSNSSHFLNARTIESKTFQVTEKQMVAPDGQPGLFVQNWVDITDLEEGQRLLEEFVSSVSHEFRTPLTSIKGYLELVMKDQTLEGKNRNYLRIVEANADRLIRVVHDLLDLSRIEGGALHLDLQPQQLRPLILETIESFVTQFENKNILWDVEIAPELGVIQADHDRLVQVLSNLLSNACKYTPDGGKVSLAVKSNDGWIAIEVSDTGVGISEAEQSKIFSRFYRTHEARLSQIQGAGLGLAITKSLVEKMGGSISFRSEQGKGSTFTVAFPTPAVESTTEPVEQATVSTSAG